MTSVPFSVCVYCGSRLGTLPVYADAARGLGRAIGERGWRLVYGGGRVGLMGVVADATLAAGGTVLGVIPESLMRREVGHADLTELLVVPDMHQRKQRMAEAADAFIALPGGIGTFEEWFEAWTWRHLGYHDRPLGLLDAGDFWHGMLDFLRHTREQGFVDDTQMGMFEVATDPTKLLDTLAAQARVRRQGGDYSRI